MKDWSLRSGAVVGVVVVAAIAQACGSANGSAFFNGPGAGGTGTASSSGGGSSGSVPIFETDGGLATSPGQSSGGGVACPPGLSCNVACSGGGTTTVSGKVYDPAGENPLYNVAVYVPATPLVPLPKGVPTGADACSCDALFPSGALTNTTTAVDGTFTLQNVPVGDSVPLVIQIGKWRRQVSLKVTACQSNAQPDKALALPGTVPAGDTNDNIPDIAVSTGEADTLECLMLRIGMPASEYVAGAGGSGHVHVFSGGNNGTGGTGSGKAESPPMSGAPASYSSLWDTAAHMMPYDVVLLSCEGAETYNSNPPALEEYLNAGGRAFASHFHYAWFAGSLTGDTTVPAPPNDWGNNLAAWISVSSVLSNPGGFLGALPSGHAEVAETLTGSSKPFPKGVDLDQWLGIVDALGVEGAPAGQIPIFEEKINAGATNKAQAWLTDNGTTDYFSFDTPVNAPVPADGGAPQYCGRAVFAGVHVSGDPNAASAKDANPPPHGCAPGELSPQEKALEFMLFDLSSCVLPDTVAPPVDAGLPPPAPK